MRGAAFSPLPGRREDQDDADDTGNKDGEGVRYVASDERVLDRDHLFGECVLRHVNRQEPP